MSSNVSEMSREFRPLKKVKLLWFEYLGQNAITAAFMKGPTSRYSNLTRILAQRYSMEVIKCYTNVRGRFADLLDFVRVVGVTSIRVLIGSPNVDVIYTAPGRSWIAGFILKALKRVVWIADINDTADGELVADNLKKTSPWDYSILGLLKATILSHANKIVGDPFAINELKERGFDENYLVTLPDGANVQMFRTGNGEKIRENYGLQSKCVVLYDGKLLRSYGVERIIQSIAGLQEKHPNINLLIVGDGPALTYLKECASRLCVADKVIFTGLQPYVSMPDFVAAADICVLPFGNQGLQLWEWFAAGKLVVTIKSPNLIANGLRDKVNCILVDSPCDLQAGLEFALKHINELGSISKNAALLADELDWEQLCCKLNLAILDALRP